MKKVLAILVVLLMVPFVSMAATMSDADLAAVTGQSGVSIGISSLQLGVGINTITWGDYDGDQSYSTGFNYAGYVNVAVYPVPMHVGIGQVDLTIDVGTNTLGHSAVILGVMVPSAITIDAFVADILVDSSNGAVTDYHSQLVAGTSYVHDPSAYATSVGLSNNATLRAATGALTVGNGLAYMTKELGVFGISGVSITIPQSLVVTIAPH